MTNEELVIDFQKRKDPGTLAEICERNKGLVFSIVHGFREVFSSEDRNRAALIESGDLEQDGFEGLIRAAYSFDNERGAAFSSAASLYIRAAIIKSLNERYLTFRMSDSLRRKVRNIKRVKASFLEAHGREPSPEETAYFLNVSVDDYYKTLREVPSSDSLGSLDAVISQDGTGQTIGDLIPAGADPMGEVENRLFMEQLKETLWGMVGQLETRQSEILKEHYKDGESLKEIAAKRNISAERARQIREKGLAALREFDRLEVLEEYAQGLHIADSMAYRGTVGGYHRTWTSATEKAAFRRIEARARASRQYPKDKGKNQGMSYSDKMAWLKIYGQYKQSADAMQLKLDRYRLNNPNGRLDGLADLPGKLEAERGKEQRALKELLQALESVKDPDFSRLLCLRYVQLKKWKQISNEMGLSAAHCKGKFHRMAVDALELSELKS